VRVVNVVTGQVVVPLPRSEPKRLRSVDVISLTPVEAYAVLVHLAGHGDPVVAGAVWDAVAEVVKRTRGAGPRTDLRDARGSSGSPRLTGASRHN
jgi:hypothetical protein